jgi:hypothetical protein
MLLVIDKEKKLSCCWLIKEKKAQMLYVILPGDVEQDDSDPTRRCGAR